MSDLPSGPDVLEHTDPKSIGRRLQDARRSRGLTQQAAADQLGVARTTITAIEKGERRVRPAELMKLAALYGRAVGELVRQTALVEPFVVQLRAALAPDTSIEEQMNPASWVFQRFCEDYLELEQICAAPLLRRYPPPYQLGSGVDPEASAEDIASAERLRLGIGDGPLINLRELLDDDVGLRIFYLALPSRIAAMFTFTEQLGGCIAINRNHPEERRRYSLCHDYGHFLTNRYRPEVSFVGRYQRQPEHERFADAFARAFLMPSSGLSRRYNDLRLGRNGSVNTGDLFRLAHSYYVSVEALVRRLEELRLLSLGTWERLQQKGLRVREAQAQLGLVQPPTLDQTLPRRYQYLAVEAYERGELSEGQLARLLHADRLEARRVVAELTSGHTISDEGTPETLELNLGESVPTRA